MIHWLAHWLGLDNLSGPIYAFLSGAGSIIIPPVLSVAGFAVVFWWHNRCPVRSPRPCWRIGRHPVEGTLHKVCRHHHPDGHLTAEKVLADHRDAKLSRVLTRPRGKEASGG